MKLRGFQLEKCAEVEAEWEKLNRFVMLIAPTGSGKTVMLSELIFRATQKGGNVIAVAHRQELVSQISMTLAKYGIKHRILNKTLIKGIAAQHAKAFKGKTFIDPKSKVAVAGVKALIALGKFVLGEKAPAHYNTIDELITAECSKKDKNGKPVPDNKLLNKGLAMGIVGYKTDDPFINGTRLLVIDEAHHVTAENEWGKAVAMMHPQCNALLPTATPVRGDKKGLGKGEGGVADSMVLAPQMRDIINMGFLLDYEIYCPVVSRLHVDDLAISDITGDFNQKENAQRVADAQIVGDTIQAYLDFGQGEKAVVFNVSVEEAEKTAAAFRAKGIPAECLSSLTPPDVRRGINERMKTGETRIVCNVDVLGEGYDLSDLRVCIMARPTASFGLFTQQFGRVLRLELPDWISHPDFNELTDEERLEVLALSPKPFGIIIDQVGNIERLGLPDARIEWTLASQKKRGKKSVAGDAIPLTHCESCFKPYERFYDACPYCGAVKPPRDPSAPRELPEQVDGDFAKLSPEVLAAMRGDIERFDTPPKPSGMGASIDRKNLMRHQMKKSAQNKLRATIDLWSGWRTAEGESDSEIRSRFFFQFKIDMLGAQVLDVEAAHRLRDKIEGELELNNVEEASGE